MTSDRSLAVFGEADSQLPFGGRPANARPGRPLAASDGALRRLFAAHINKRRNLLNVNFLPGSVGMETRLHEYSWKAVVVRKIS